MIFVSNPNISGTLSDHVNHDNSSIYNEDCITFNIIILDLVLRKFIIKYH